MKHFLTVTLILLASIAAAAQTAAEPSKVEQVQDVVGALIGRSDKAAVLLNDLAELDGYVTRLDADSFEIKADRKKRGAMKVRYADVLAISSKKASVSFVPDPKASPYGTWSDLGKIPTNALIEVTHKDGTTRSGRFRTSAAGHLVIAHAEKPDEWKIQRDEIAFVHRVKYGWRDTTGGITDGAKKGERIGTRVGQAGPRIRGPISGTTGSGGGLARPIGAGIGAVGGAIKGGADKTDGLKVLVYSQ